MNLHSKIEDFILKQINEGSLQPGDQIPTETELSVIFSASRPTVRQALLKLTAQGYLIRTKGKGSFVAQPKVLHESTSFISSYRQESEKKGQELVTKVISLKLITGELPVTEKLKISKGSKVICLTRVRRVTNFNKERPVVYTTVYVPYKKFPEMLQMDFNVNSFYDALAERGYPVRHARRKLEVVIPEESVSETLKISRFEPAIFISSIGYTENGTVIEYAESYYPAGCSQFMIEINH